LVEAIEVDRNEEGKTRARITYRFGPPADAASLPEHEEGATEGERVHVESNSLKFDNPLVPLLSVVAGLVVGDLLGIERALKRLGDYLEGRFSKGRAPSAGLS
jgi:hypothetical protein